MAADLSFEGCNFLRQRLVLATLSGKSVRIRNIRTADDDPGLKGVSFLFIGVGVKLTFKIFVNH